MARGAFETIDYVAHDTARVAAGGGSHSGRSMKLATTIIGQATDDIIDKGRRIASHLFEASVADIEFAEGRFASRAPIATSASLMSPARRRHVPTCRRNCAAARRDLRPDLPIASFPYGTQVCEVEVDPDTGAVEIVRYAAVDDVGRAINPMIVHGQTHGGIAQGVGQALLEHSHYDPATGQLLAASFMDYAMPRADVFPHMSTALSEVPSPTNRLACAPAARAARPRPLAVVINAIVDALSHLGVRHIEMPATPERVWRAIQAAAKGS